MYWNYAMYVSKPAPEFVLANPRVLLIEDDEAVAQAMIRGMERSGMSVVYAATGAGGIILKANFNPNVILGPVSV
jgi:ActR/RegA family two-component response regulator